MPNENPWAYNETRKRSHEQWEREQNIEEVKKEDFEKAKEHVRKKNTFDVFELKRKIETGNSLDTLKEGIKQALREGTISINTYQKTLDALNQDKTVLKWKARFKVDAKKLPFSQNVFALYLEDTQIGENILVDIAGFFYGLVVQWSAILIILAWKILTDFLFLPRDILNEIQSQR